MLISELIKELEVILDAKGDIPVFCNGYDGYYYPENPYFYIGRVNRGREIHYTDEEWEESDTALML